MPLPTVPSVVVFDVNETLSDMAPVAGRFADLGLPPQLAATWFASVLRDGFALAVAGEQQPFATIAAGALRTAFAGAQLDTDTDAAVEHVLAGLRALRLHPDVATGLRALTGAGRRLVTLSNGASSVAEDLLAAAGVRDAFEQLLSVADAGVWKPARESYRYASRQCGTPPGDMLLVAVHPWDVDGAARAGMQTAWVDRTGMPYPPYFTPPSITVTGVDDLARRLGSAGGAD